MAKKYVQGEGVLLRSCFISRNNCFESECMGSSSLKKKQVNNRSKILSLIKKSVVCGSIKSGIKDSSRISKQSNSSSGG